MPQRVMSAASVSGLFVGPAVFEHLNQRETYSWFLRPRLVGVKHGERLQCYEYRNLELPCFNKNGSFVCPSQLVEAQSNRVVRLPSRPARTDSRQERRPPRRAFVLAEKLFYG